MSVSLHKRGRIHDLPELDMIMGNEEWRSTVMLPMYLSTVFAGHPELRPIMAGLKANDPRWLARLLRLNHRYDNVTAAEYVR